MRNNSSGGGLGLIEVLQIIFIVLKLLGVINWTWPVVLIPLWIDLGLILFVIIWEMFS